MEPASPALTEIIESDGAETPVSPFHRDAMTLIRLFYNWMYATDMSLGVQDHCHVIELFMLRDVLADENPRYLRTCADLMAVVMAECGDTYLYETTAPLVDHLCGMIARYA